MSYDLEIWSVRPFQRAFLSQIGHPPNPASNYCTLSGDGWQIVINPSDKVLPEDVEEEISPLVPGIRYVTALNLEGKQTNAAAKLLESTAKAIAKGAHGVIVDPQSDEITTPAGVTRFVPPKKAQAFSAVVMTWWLLNDTMHKADGRRAFLSLLGKRLPEALPARYGEYAPPQHVFSRTGVEHLQRFIGKRLDNVMEWYPRRPVVGVTVSCPKPPGPGERGFRMNYVSIDVETAALTQPGWMENLLHFWRQMTFLLQPIYGEARTEGGYLRRGAAISFNAAEVLKKDRFAKKTRSWFWRGIPSELGHAVVLGKEYQRLWPSFGKKATVEKGFAFASTPDWSSKLDVSRIVGAPPKAIVLLPGEGMGPKQRYPKSWPFEPPFRRG